ncbi:hypothetical protein [Paenibacillus turpanensis]|uniref:hypothetical protein n=1 Tax=Paenibacillus turpanensis TaxID=2689078 RepID=UPI00140A45F5|nr:hypothetical protein [Paenibacillus turpanensis]
MKKLMAVLIVFVLLITGCGTSVSPGTFGEAQPPPAPEQEEEPPDVKETVTLKEQAEVPMEKEEESSQASTVILDGNTISVDLKVIDYVQKLEGFDSASDELLFYETTDLDQDGKQEAVLAFGQKYENAVDTYVTHSYVLRNNGGEVEVLGSNLIGGSAYNTYEVNVIELKGSPHRYVYHGLTNGGNLSGFLLYKLEGNEIVLFDGSASATGSGMDELVSSGEDGIYDGYISDRSSYDVYYIPVQKYYHFDGSKFVLSGTSVSLPEKPTTPREALFQFLSLTALMIDNEDLSKRLSELCSCGQYEFNEREMELIRFWLDEHLHGLSAEEEAHAETSLLQEYVELVIKDNLQQAGKDGGEQAALSFRLKPNGTSWVIEKVIRGGEAEHKEQEPISSLDTAKQQTE